MGNKQYEFVKLRTGTMIGATSEKHREIIRKYAAEGYRYVGYIPRETTHEGVVWEIDLVFERED